jgi:hypothetical protein
MEVHAPPSTVLDRLTLALRAGAEAVAGPNDRRRFVLEIGWRLWSHFQPELPRFPEESAVSNRAQERWLTFHEMNVNFLKPLSECHRLSFARLLVSASYRAGGIPFRLILGVMLTPTRATEHHS